MITFFILFLVWTSIGTGIVGIRGFYLINIFSYEELLKTSILTFINTLKLIFFGPFSLFMGEWQRKLMIGD